MNKEIESYYHIALALTSVCRIAANEPSFLSFHLRIQDQRDKQKLNIKALDAVLFGPPTRKDQSILLSYVSLSSSVQNKEEQGESVFSEKYVGRCTAGVWTS